MALDTANFEAYTLKSQKKNTVGGRIVRVSELAIANTALKGAAVEKKERIKHEGADLQEGRVVAGKKQSYFSRSGQPLPDPTSLPNCFRKKQPVKNKPEDKAEDGFPVCVLAN